MNSFIDLSKEGIDKMSSAREHIAWLLWCAHEGYINAEDRAILDMNGDNFVTLMSQNPDDLAALPHWLGMADEVLVAMKITQSSEDDDEQPCDRCGRVETCMCHPSTWSLAY